MRQMITKPKRPRGNGERNCDKCGDNVPYDQLQYDPWLLISARRRAVVTKSPMKKVRRLLCDNCVASYSAMLDRMGGDISE